MVMVMVMVTLKTGEIGKTEIIDTFFQETEISREFENFSARGECGHWTRNVGSKIEARCSQDEHAV